MNQTSPKSRFGGPLYQPSQGTPEVFWTEEEETINATLDYNLLCCHYVFRIQGADYTILFI